jgi:uncharacterized membrane protein
MSIHRAPSLSNRLAYIDWARGLAVLIMIGSHTVDAWTRASARRGPVFRDAVMLGGFAAPLFLWLAGVGVVLSAASTMRRGGSRKEAAAAVCRRGLEIFILAFLFRLQGFILTPGSHVVTLFRVDILNIMGPGIICAGLVLMLAESPKVLAAAYAVLAAAFAMAAPIVRTSAAIERLPLWVQWYLRPAGDMTMFTSFPWAGFVFAGAAVGALLTIPREPAIGSRLVTRSGGHRVHAALALAGLALVWIGFYTASLPAIYRQSSFWTSSPTYFAIRVGVITTAFALLYALEQMAVRIGVALTALERLGRRSLFVYWIHVELVYGYATWPIHGRLPLWGVGLAYVMFTALMYGAVVWFERHWSAPRQMTLEYKAHAV